MLKVLDKQVNSNIRCIEIIDMSGGLFIDDSVNSNIRFIEIGSG